MKILKYALLGLAVLVLAIIGVVAYVAATFELNPALDQRSAEASGRSNVAILALASGTLTD